MRTPFGRRFQAMVEQASVEKLRNIAVECGVPEEAFEITNDRGGDTMNVSDAAKALEEMLVEEIRSESEHQNRMDYYKKNSPPWNTAFLQHSLACRRVKALELALERLLKGI